MARIEQWIQWVNTPHTARYAVMITLIVLGVSLLMAYMLDVMFHVGIDMKSVLILTAVITASVLLKGYTKSKP